METQKLCLLKIAIILSFIWLVCAEKSFSQNKTFKNIYEIADELLYDNKYDEALPLWKMLDSISPNNPNIAFNIGLCYLNSTEKEKAIPLFELASKKVSVDYEGSYNEKNAPIFVYYFLGEAFHSENKIDEAMKNYKKFKSLIPKEEIEEIEEIDTEIKYCIVAKKIISNPLMVNIENLGPNINSSHSDYAPILYSDGQLYFTSKRDLTNVEVSRSIMDDKETIYLSKFNKEKNIWEKAIDMSEPFKCKVNIASIGKSWDEKGIYIFRNDKSEDGDIYYCAKSENGWGTPNKLSKKINTNSMEYHSCISYDGSIMFFVSERKGGYGGKDIWKTEKDANGEWTDPVNLGPKINTSFDEEAPFITMDGKTLYFSSAGHESMGDYDVFYSKLENKKWTKAKNLGSPINSIEDDVYFSPSNDGLSAIYSSSRTGGYGEMDIYKINFDIKNKEIQLNCNAIDQELSPVLADIVLKDLLTNQIIEPSFSNKYKGEATFNVQNQKNYEVSFYQNENLLKTENLLISSEKSSNQNFNFPENLYLENAQESITKEFVIDNNSEIATNEITLKEDLSKIELKSVYFGFDKSNITEEITTDIENVLKIINSNSNFKIQLLGHTDNIGTDAYNDNLSILRAVSVEKALEEKGISKNRIEVTGCGFHKPISTNFTKLGREMNRRTEIKILNENNEVIYSSINKVIK
jgi:outer membrane protein OmpA-like peptidoglycan-associated protein